MGFLIPSALALLGLAIPIIIFYMLKLRRQPARVSSLLLWEQVLQDRQANTPWQKLKRNLLLFLQLLILLLLVLALARPFLTVEAQVQGNIVMLLDASASMQATDVNPTRFEAAQQAALDVINRLNSEDAVTLIAVEHEPRVLASGSTDHAALQQTLNGAQASNSPADWQSALTLAAANASTLPDTTIVIISDGALGAEFEGLSLPAPVEFIPIGEGSENQGIVALSLRDGSDGTELFIRVANASEEEATRRVDIAIDGELFDARELDIPAGESASLALRNLPLDTRQVHATLAGEDDLAVDDQAWAVRSAAPAQVLLVSPGNFFLERALGLIPGVQPQRATPEQSLPERDFDLVIFDRALPNEGDDLPASNLFFIAPPESTPLFEVTGVITRPTITRRTAEHPVMTYVELSTLNVAEVQAINPPPWSDTLVASRSGPLLAAGEREGQRVAILAFDIHRSDLPLQIDFPILTINLMRWLLPGENLEQAQTLRAGESFDLPTASSADALIVQTPRETAQTISPEVVNFDGTRDLGVYQILAQEGDDEPDFLGEFAVNLLSETETRLQPDMPAITGAESTATAEGSPRGRWEWWWLLVVAGLGVLFVEWWLYWRGEVR